MPTPHYSRRCLPRNPQKGSPLSCFIVGHHVLWGIGTPKSKTASGEAGVYRFAANGTFDKGIRPNADRQFVTPAFAPP
jgi:hypothetical protein